MTSGELISGYSINKTLNQGNNTVVYEASRQSDNEKFILKTCLNPFPKSEEIALLTKEYNTLSTLGLPGINKALDLIQFRNRPVIVFQDFGGITIHGYLENNKLSISEFLVIAVKIVDTLGKIHANNFMHKDINPSNILINPNSGEIRIIDFELSTNLSLERSIVQNPNSHRGTLHYMSPEQTGRMNRSMDYRTDLYSLGITFYEMLTGELPFQSEDPIEILYGHIAKKIEPSMLKTAGVPDVVSNIVLKLTEKIVENRYQSAMGLKFDLEKCLNLIQEDGTIPNFKIAEKDVFSKFRLSENLYSREKEIQLMLQIFEEVENGGCKLLLINGSAGVGKTALVNEIHKPLLKQKGYFISGKFDQFKTHLPFSAFSSAFSELIKYLLVEPDNKLENLNQELKNTLGLDTNVLAELVPEIELILGPQEAAAELNPTESKYRFFYTLIEFVKVFAKQEHPLIIFIDDLQWCDDSSLSLIQQLIVRGIPYLFIIGSYRDNEINEGHPLKLTFEEIQLIKPIDQIHLNPLDQQSVNQMIADTLQSNLEETKPLTSIIFKKTAGNPFYVNELLKTIHNNKSIFFNYETKKWHWSIDKIAALNISGNVVELMTSRLKEFAPDCLRILKLAACIGNSFDLRTLSLVTGLSAKEISSKLWPALEEEIVIPDSEEYLYITESEDFGVTYKFQHDRILQSVYLLVNAQKLQENHLKIGRVLLEHLSETEKNDKLIELVRHLNEGRALIENSLELNQLLELNLQAGEKAESSIAYQSALNYFKFGIELLPDNCWETQYQNAFDLYIGYARNAYQVQDFTAAEKAIDLLLSKALTKLDKVQVLSTRLRQYATIGKTKDAIRLGIDGLKLLGYKLPEKPSTLTVLKEVFMAKWNLGRRKPADLLNDKILEDPEKRAAARLFTEIGPSAYVLGNSNLYGLTNLKVVNLSLLHGICPESSFAYISFGAVLADAFGDFQAAEEFGNLAIAINEKLDNIEYRCRVIAAYGVLTFHFNHHWETIGDWFKKGVSAGFLSGDLFFLAYCAKQITTFHPSMQLELAIKEQEKFLKVIEDTDYQDALDSATMDLQYLKNLVGLTEHPHSMSDDKFDESQRLENMIERNYVSGVGMYHINKAKIYLSLEVYDLAWDHILEADKYNKSLFSLIYLVQQSYSAFFICAGLIDSKSSIRGKLKKRMKKELAKMRKWAAYNPINFKHWQLLMEAEFAYLENRTNQAAKLYEKSIQLAHENKWLSIEAFANEQAAKFYLRLGIRTAAVAYLKSAYYLYQKWGANSKLKYLENAYSELLDLIKSTISIHPVNSHFTTSGSESFQNLDVGALFKSYQAISGEIELNSLLKTTMQIALVNEGAENGMLLLEKDNNLYIQAIAKDNEVKTMQHILAKQSKLLPKTIINYVSRTHEAIILDDAAKHSQFSEDAYIQANQTKSVLCSPIMFLKKLYGIIYLENNISVGVFTEERLRLLNLLSSQMAVSIQNAHLYANLEHKVEERTMALRAEKKKSDELLHNILPEEVANELKKNGLAKARQFDNTTVLVTDFINFTKISESLTPKELVAEIDLYFTAFDEIVERNGLEKIKTNGDAYLGVCGMPIEFEDHAVKAVNAALDISRFVEERKNKGGLFDIRIGLNSGPVVAGIVGVKKFAYDIWGDTVNTAARMESHSSNGRINISDSTYQLVKNDFNCKYRGGIEAKNKGMIDMFFVEGPKEKINE